MALFVFFVVRFLDLPSIVSLVLGVSIRRFWIAIAASQCVALLQIAGTPGRQDAAMLAAFLAQAAACCIGAGVRHLKTKKRASEARS